MSQAYASNFAGRGKIHRLLFIAQKADSEHASLEAFRLAADELKKVWQLLYLAKEGPITAILVINVLHVQSLAKRHVLASAG